MKYSYSVKIMNPSRKTNFSVHKLGVTHELSSFGDVQDELSRMLHTQVTQVGYVLPGHGWKEKLKSLDCNSDIRQMYVDYGKKTDILLWCYALTDDNHSDCSATEKRSSKQRKRSNSPDKATTDQPRSKRNTCAKKIKEVEAIVLKLKEQHESKFSVEKINAWAHMIHMGKHTSYTVPPNLPYFGKQKCGDSTEVPQSTSTTSVATLSPGKRINLRSECMDQLSKRHTLLEKGAITQAQYAVHQKTILGDIADLLFSTYPLIV